MRAPACQRFCGASVAAVVAAACFTAQAHAVTGTFTSPGSISVADGEGPAPSTPGRGEPYPSTIDVTGVTGPITDVDVGLSGITHGYPDDLDVLLVGPNGASVVLLSDAGEGFALESADLRFDDQAGAPAPDVTALVRGETYRPTNHFGGRGEETVEEFPAAFPPPRSATLAGAFAQSEANGRWRLYVLDDRPGDIGGVARGWSVTLTTSDPPPPDPPPGDPPPPGPAGPPGPTTTTATTTTSTVSTPTPFPAPVPVLDVFPTTPLAGQPILLDGFRSAAGSGNLVRYDWDVDGRVVASCFDQTGLTISALTSGTHTVGLTATDAAGALARVARVVQVRTPPRPRAARAAQAPLARCRRPAYDLRAKGLEITQGVQGFTPSSKGGQLPSRFPFDRVLPDPPGPVPYRGVPLAARDQTVVRFFADAGNAPVEGTIATLSGTRNGSPLPGGPLLPIDGPTKLTDRGCVACVTADEREDANAAFSFVLPDSWTEGAITLTGGLIPPSATFDRVGRRNGPPECAGEPCLANNRFTLSGIGFTRTPHVVIQPVRLIIKGRAALPDPQRVFAPALNLVPGGRRFEVRPYGSDVDVTTIAGYKRDSPECASYHPDNHVDDKGVKDGLDKFNDCRNDLFYAQVGKYEAANRGTFDLAIGVNAQERGKGSQLQPVEWAEAAPIALVDVNRPLTSVAHELGHNLGRAHAGTEAKCPDGGGVAWPPDDRGLMQGIGLDRRTTTRGARGFQLPFRLIGPGLPGRPIEMFDLMSYCASSDESRGGDSWTSPRHWDDTLRSLESFGTRVGLGPRLFARLTLGGTPGAAGPLRVQAMLGAGGASITSVVPTGRAGRPPAASDFTLVARDAAGAVLETVPMAAQSGHSEPGAAFTFLQGTLRAGRAASVTVARGPALLATRTRNPSPPRVRILAPRVLRGGGVDVRWTATDADGGTLEASVDVSHDGGRSWRTAHVGPSTGRTSLPVAYVPGSRRARVRVRVSDGFNQTTAASRSVRTPGRAPQVRIALPLPGSSLPNDATLSLRGSAFDDRSEPLRGSRLTWFAGRRRIGTGEAAAVTGLPPGQQRVRLVATDRAGRSATASRFVRVRGSAPTFLELAAPEAIGRRARVVRLRVVASLPSLLRVGSKRVRVGRGRQVVSVPVVPGGRALHLRLRLTAYGRTSVRPLTVRR